MTTWPPPDAFVVTLGDLRLFGMDPVSMAEFYVASLEGWDGPDMRTTLIARQNDHGAFAPVVFYDARKMTITGTIAGADLAARRRGEARLKATLAALDGTALRVTEQPYDRTVTVWTNGPLTTTKSGAVTRFSLPVIAADPIRYASSEVDVAMSLPQPGPGHGYPYGYPLTYGGGTSGDAVLTNDGDAEVWPLLRIDGPVVNPVVANATTGQTLQLALTLVDGEWLDIDGRDEIVTVDGAASRRSAVAAGSVFPTLPAGDSRWQFRAGSASSATLTVRYRSGWS